MEDYWLLMTYLVRNSQKQTRKPLWYIPARQSNPRDMQAWPKRLFKWSPSGKAGDFGQHWYQILLTLALRRVYYNFMDLFEIKTRVGAITLELASLAVDLVASRLVSVTGFQASTCP